MCVTSAPLPSLQQTPFGPENKHMNMNVFSGVDNYTTRDGKSHKRYQQCQKNQVVLGTRAGHIKRFKEDRWTLRVTTSLLEGYTTKKMTRETSQAGGGRRPGQIPVNRNQMIIQNSNQETINGHHKNYYFFVVFNYDFLFRMLSGGNCCCDFCLGFGP